MKRRSKRDEEKKNMQSIFDKLQSVEKRIHEIESSLKRIDRSSILTTEDQFFFGLVFPLALLLVTLPEFDACTLFESFGVKIEASQGIISTKVLLITLLIIASGVRYAVTFAKDAAQRNKIRMISVAFVISSIYFLIMEVFFRGLGDLLKNVHVYLILFPPVALMLVAALTGNILEKKWYRYYGYGEPIISIIFGLMGLSVLITYYLAMIVANFIQISGVTGLFLLIASIPISLLFFRVSIRIYGGLKRNLKSFLQWARAIVHS